MAKEISVLLPAECVLDKDMGILKLVQFNYRNTDIWLNDLLDNLELEIQEYLMSTRTNINPLSIILKEEEWEDNLDSLYSQLYDSDYDTIVKLSTSTNLINMLSSVMRTETPLRISVLFEKEIDEVILRKRIGYTFKNFEPIILPKSEWGNIDMGLYDSVYVKYAQDLELFKVLDGKNIYISDLRVNMIDSEEQALVPSVLKYMIDNKISIFSLYDFSDIDIED